MSWYKRFGWKLSSRGSKSKGAAASKGEAAVEGECGWDVFLRFNDQELEHDFCKHYNLASVEWDRYVYPVIALVGLVFELCLLLVHGGNGGGSTFLGWVAVTIAQIFMISSNRGWYQANRTKLLACSHVLHSMLALVSSKSVPRPANTEQGLLLFYLLRSPTMILLLFAFGMMIPFEVHIVSQLVSCMASTPWVFMFCSYCGNSDTYHNFVTSKTFLCNTKMSIDIWLQRFSIVGGIVEAIDGKILHASLAENEDMCWEPILFMHLVVGYIIPCAFVYCIEAYRRFAFASVTVKSVTTRQKYRQNFRIAIILALWMATTLSQCVWLIITVAADRLQFCSSLSMNSGCSV